LIYQCGSYLPWPYFVFLVSSLFSGSATLICWLLKWVYICMIHIAVFSAKDQMQAIMLPVEILFAENHSSAFARPMCSRYGRIGLLLRQLWTWTCLILVAAFSSTIKSIMIKEPEQKLISKIHEIPDSGIPVTFFAASYLQFEQLKYSPIVFDNWLHENADDVIIWTDQY